MKVRNSDPAIPVCVRAPREWYQRVQKDIVMVGGMSEGFMKGVNEDLGPRPGAIFFFNPSMGHLVLSGKF